MNTRSAPAGRERSTDPPGSQTAIREGEVHVWHGTLEASPDAVTPAEESRARRMGSPRRRREFLVARGALRRVLAAALGIDPLVVPIREGAHGKPDLVPRRPSLPPIGFNLSHSGDRFIVALALGLEPGVDVELIRPRRSLDLLARHCFSPAERRAVAGDPDPMHAFYRVWSRKEAVIKADGRGVSIGLDRFDVNVGEPAALLHARWKGAAPEEAAHWSLRSLDAGPGYAAALAVRCPGATVVIRTGAVPSRPVTRG